MAIGSTEYIRSDPFTGFLAVCPNSGELETVYFADGIEGEEYICHYCWFEVSEEEGEIPHTLVSLSGLRQAIILWLEARYGDPSRVV